MTALTFMQKLTAVNLRSSLNNFFTCENSVDQDQLASVGISERIFRRKTILKKYQQTTKNMQNYPGGKELTCT